MTLSHDTARCSGFSHFGVPAILCRDCQRMTDLQTLVKQTSNASILKMQQRLHDEVVTLGKQALKWKADYEALQLAFETERAAANLYAKQVAHWIEKHDALLAQQLEASESRDAYAAAADTMAAAHKVERDALKDAARLALDALEQCNAADLDCTMEIAALKAVLK